MALSEHNILFKKNGKHFIINSCNVCKEKFKDNINEKIIAFFCGHIIHDHCSSNIENYCPICYNDKQNYSFDENGSNNLIDDKSCNEKNNDKNKQIRWNKMLACNFKILQKKKELIYDSALSCISEYRLVVFSD